MARHVDLARYDGIGVRVVEEFRSGRTVEKRDPAALRIPCPREAPKHDEAPEDEERNADDVASDSRACGDEVREVLTFPANLLVVRREVLHAADLVALEE